MIFPKLLLCTDLDRTLLPNGPEPESQAARPLFRRLCDVPEVTLVYVSGRDKGLILESIDHFNLPYPDYAITDVGSIIYEVKNKEWKVCEEWTEEIASSWGTYDTKEIHQLLKPVSQLKLQELSKQNTYKLSYYLSLDISHTEITEKIKNLLQELNIDSNIIFSIDTVKATGLIDILPAKANKLTAILWLANRLHMKEENIIFAGDSGNDIDVISSSISSIIVANATADFKSLALSSTQTMNTKDKIYIASGRLTGMNGNYAAGILEGLCHYLPEACEWLTSESSSFTANSS